VGAAFFFFFKQKTAYEITGCDWSSDVCSSDLLRIGNTGRCIAPSAQEHIFDRFYHDSEASVAGHGLGLNLARELARLHGGDLKLVRSENDWTEFEVRFHVANAVANPSG